MFGQGKICVSGRKSFAKYFLSEFSVLKVFIAKIISPVIFDHSFKRLNALFLTKNLFSEVF